MWRLSLGSLVSVGTILTHTVEHFVTVVIVSFVVIHNLPSLAKHDICDIFTWTETLRKDQTKQILENN